ncbi:MAG: helix-turn-helix domain-containing protein [Endomicrobium sp.]|jgi:excisionase family DNA binding protein|nr:helix-turn-helix domain-containing protein [Endomicrobium sp.]
MKDTKNNSKIKYLRIKDFAEIFNLHKQTVSVLIREGKINAVKIYGTTAWRIPIEEVESYKQKSIKQTKKDIFTRDF